LSGRQALVHMQSIGEIAIRTLQTGPVKKGKRTYTLHALNAMYPPEPLNGSIVGIVVGVFRLHPFATL